MAIVDGLAAGQLGVTLLVKDPLAAAAFYRDALGAREVRRWGTGVGAPRAGEAVTAVELRLGAACLTVTMENPRWREAPRPDWPRSPQSAGTTTAFLTCYVDDVDAVLARALAAGASLPSAEAEPVQDAFWGDRVAQFVDPAGHVWRVQTRLEDVAFDELPARFEALQAARRAARAAAAKT